LSDQPLLVWLDRPIITIGELFGAVSAIHTPEEAELFMEAYRAVNEHADANVGYVIGYSSDTERERLYKLFGLAHPVFKAAV